MSYLVAIGGSEAARKRYPARTYQSWKSAQRRMKQIHEEQDPGVETIWALRVDPEEKTP